MTVVDCSTFAVGHVPMPSAAGGRRTLGDNPSRCRLAAAAAAVAAAAAGGADQCCTKT